MNFNFKKKFGQNFLKNNNVINKICDCFNKHDDFYEIGPGAGSLTKEFLKRNKKINAIELDQECIELLKNLKNENLNIIHQDVLNYEFKENCVVVGNLPYNIGTKIIENLIFANFSYGVFMLQKEVAQRILFPNSSKLGIFVNACYDVKKIIEVAPNSFIPAPKVDSMVIELKRNERKIDLKKIKYISKLFYLHKKKKINFVRKIDENVFEVIKKLNWNLNLRCHEIAKEKYYELANLI